MTITVVYVTTVVNDVVNLGRRCFIKSLPRLIHHAALVTIAELGTTET